MEALYALALLACPVGMGVMMWWMMRGTKTKSPVQDKDPRTVEELRAEQVRISSEIDRLSTGARTEDGHLAGSRR